MKTFFASTALLLVLILHQSFLCSKLPATTDTMLSSLSQDIYVLASDSLEGRGTGTEGELKAGRYIQSRFMALGLTPKGENATWFQSFTFKPHPPVQMHQVGDSVKMGMALVKEVTGRNVIGFIDHKAEFTVVIGAHYDHLGYGDENSLFTEGRAIHNGADDNASGVAAMIELARRIKAKPADYKNYNYLFIAFSGEEKGLWGSNYFSKNPTVPIEKINCMLNMDMVGRLKPERTLAVHGVGTTSLWSEWIGQIQVDSIQVVPSESGVGPSDHTSFYNVGVPVLHFFTGQHGDYHKPSDDANLINYAGVLSVVNYIDAILLKIHGAHKLGFIKTKDESTSTAADFKVTLGVIPDYLFSGPGMRIDGTRDGRPAAKAGLKQGDVILKIGDVVVTDMMTYMEALGSFSKGESSVVQFERNGETSTTTVTWD